MEQNEFYKDSIIYTSSEFPYQPLIRTRVNVKSKSGDEEVLTVNETITEPISVSVYDHKEYLQTDIVYHNNDRTPIEKSFNSFN